MVWIARDKQGLNPYRIFGSEPVRANMVGWDGEVDKKSFTWTTPTKDFVKVGFTYNPYSNTENTEISQADCPMYLLPGEGPVEVRIILKDDPAVRPFEGEGI